MDNGTSPAGDDEHALHHLRQLGIDEPLTWEPPRDWAPSLIPPGREPADIDQDRRAMAVIQPGSE